MSKDQAKGSTGTDREDRPLDAAALADRNRARLREFAIRIVGERAAPGVVDASIARAERELARGERPEEPEKWLFGIVGEEAIAELRGRPTDTKRAKAKRAARAPVKPKPAAPAPVVAPPAAAKVKPMAPPAAAKVKPAAAAAAKAKPAAAVPAKAEQTASAAKVDQEPAKQPAGELVAPIPAPMIAFGRRGLAGARAAGAGAAIALLLLAGSVAGIAAVVLGDDPDAASTTLEAGGPPADQPRDRADAADDPAPRSGGDKLDSDRSKPDDGPGTGASGSGRSTTFAGADAPVTGSPARAPAPADPAPQPPDSDGGGGDQAPATPSPQPGPSPEPAPTPEPTPPASSPPATPSSPPQPPPSSCADPVSCLLEDVGDLLGP